MYWLSKELNSIERHLVFYLYSSLYESVLQSSVCSADQNVMTNTADLVIEMNNIAKPCFRDHNLHSYTI